MNICINRAKDWLDNHRKAKQWCWFISLWIGGLASVSVLAYCIKWMMGV